MFRNMINGGALLRLGRRGSACLIAGAALVMASASAQAIPDLQIYIEGAVYDSSTDTWIFAPATPLNTIRLWTIGNVDGPGGSGTITDVRLSIAYDVALTPTFTFTGDTTDGFGGWDDPTTPSAPTLTQTVTDGSAPLLGDGSALPSHGIFGVGTAWQEFSLGDFDETTSSIADVISTFPVNPGVLGGHVNVYELTIATAPSDAVFHFDLFNSILAGNHARLIFAPFSHDGEVVPLPGAAVLAAIGFGCVGFVRRRFQ